VRLGGSNFGTIMQGNTFEPTAAGKISGVDTEAGALGQILSFTYVGNWHGDVNTAGGSQWLSLTAAANRAIFISGNQFDTIPNGEYGVVLGVGGGASVFGNAFIALGTTGRSINFASSAFQGVRMSGNYGTATGSTPGGPDLTNATDFHSDDAGFTTEIPDTYNNHRFRYEPLGTLGVNPVNVAGGGTAALAGGRGQLMSTAAALPSSASQRIVMAAPTAADIISKARRVAFDCIVLDVLSNANVYYYLTDESVDVAPSATARHLGIKGLAGVFSFTTADGTVEQTTAITAFIVAGQQQRFVIMFDGTTARLFIDGVLRATHATRVPTGGGAAVLRYMVDNTVANVRNTAPYACEVTFVM
jgi:hypothetical protein